MDLGVGGRLSWMRVNLIFVLFVPFVVLILCIRFVVFSAICTDATLTQH